ncbi:MULTISPECIES: DapH/DapD/GlmU-related protein [unclassified Empedobacter]|uniref:DapH/DapD/GlmU-related protein n=1 Tax=unclassified Empedobacter TaxID=2643773 RepID=UPI0025C27DFE|nr:MULTISPECIES: DapH/DapD/GlmU-related protein [unclassified Empedobacter]
MKNYSLIQILLLFIYKIRGYFLFKNARIIRFPFRVRGKRFIEIDKGFTTGFNCRLDAFDFNNSNKFLIKIGANVEINDDVHIAAVECVEIGDNVLIASKVFITDHNHGNYSGSEMHDSPLTIPKSRKIYTNPVKIEDNVWLGEFVSILPGVTIGKGAIIGTMSVVTKNIPPYSIAVGSPARVIKTFDFNTQEWVIC